MIKYDQELAKISSFFHSYERIIISGFLLTYLV